MYEELKQTILNKFSETENISEYYHKPAGYGYFGIVMNTHDTIRIKKKVAGLFNFEFCYSDDVAINTYEVSFMEKDEEYSSSKGKEKTIKMIGCAYEYGEEHLIADIMIASALKDFPFMSKDNYLIYSTKDIETEADAIFSYNIKQMNAMATKAINVLEENGYESWHHSTKHFVFKGSRHNFSQLDIYDFISKKKLDANDYCELILESFKWFANENNYVTFACINTKGYQFAQFESHLISHIKTLVQETSYYKSKNMTEICSNYIERLVKRYEENLNILQDEENEEVPEYCENQEKGKTGDWLDEIFKKWWEEEREESRKRRELMKPEAELKAKELIKKITDLREKETKEVFMEWLNDEYTCFRYTYGQYESYKKHADIDKEYRMARFPKRYNDVQQLLQRFFEITTEIRKGNLYSIREELLTY